MVLEKTLESPLDYKEIQPVHPKGDHSWVFIGRTDVEAKAPILWPPDSLEKTLMLGKVEGIKLLVTGQVVINSMPLIISITVGFYTALQCKNQKYPSFSEVYSAKEAAEII